MTLFSRVMHGTSLRISMPCCIERRTPDHPTNGRQDKSADGIPAHVVGWAGRFGMSALARAVSQQTLSNDLNDLHASFCQFAPEIGRG
jgi:hypothetical protein